MIDRMKECAAQYYKQQKDTIYWGEGQRDNNAHWKQEQEVSNVIQERTRSLDETSKAVWKIVQEKQKEASKMAQALFITKEELGSAKKSISEIENKNQALEAKLKEMIANTSEKSKQINKLHSEKKDCYEQSIFQMDKTVKDKDYEME